MNFQRELIARLSQANGRLKRDKIRVTIIDMRGLLSLQATLPPLPSETERKQRKIALGLPLSLDGISRAEKRARLLGRSLREGSFDWSDWRQNQKRTAQGNTLREWIERYEANYWQRRPKNPKTLTTWRYDYRKVFDRLTLSDDLTPEALLRAVLATEPDSRTRQRTVRVLSQLARFADLDIDLRPYQGNYSIHQAAPRDLPTDDEIVAIAQKISNPSWRWAYGLIAAYGLRPHEIFHARFYHAPQLDILDGKTNSRIAYPLLPKWFDLWQLDRTDCPNCTGRNNTDLGSRVTHAFKRYDVPFAPYYLRHAWAVRAIGRLDVSLAAQQLGHSVETHTKVYQHWIGAEIHRAAWERLKNSKILP